MVKRLKNRDMYYDAAQVVDFGVNNDQYIHIYFMLNNGTKVLFGRNFYDVEMAGAYAEMFMKRFQNEEEELDLFFDF